jgi:osmoprotectant transport system permease protein
MNSLLAFHNVLLLTGQYIELVFASLLIAIVAGLLLGIMITRKSMRKAAPYVLAVANIGQSLPSLAVLALVIGIMGLGFKPAVFALVIYSVLAIVQNTTTGILLVDEGIIEAAKGMGMGSVKILLSVELPLASSVILSGIRTATTVNIGTAALGSLIGAGGLGLLVFTGLSMEDLPVMLAGAVPIAIIAVIADLGVGWAVKRSHELY